MRKLIYAIVLVVSLVLIVSGHRHIGPAGLCTMLLGLFGLISLLWYYNKSYK